MERQMTKTQLHATCVAIGGAGVLLRGPSGAGKSDLALRLIDSGAVLVADDRVDILLQGGRLIGAAPDTIAGMIEVRGVGVIRIAHAGPTLIALVVDLVARNEVQRLPTDAHTDLLDIAIRYLRLNAFDSSTPAKIRLVLASAPGAMVEPT